MIAVRIECHNLPHPSVCGGNRLLLGTQLRKAPHDVIEVAPGGTATFDAELEIVTTDGTHDQRGPFVQGRKGDRFLYLTWGNGAGDEPGDDFGMFRRAKLKLNDLTDAQLDAAAAGKTIVASVDGTLPDGTPACAGLKPPQIEWSVE